MASPAAAVQELLEDRLGPSQSAEVLPPEGRGLKVLWLEITGGCNLECVHCYAKSGPQEFARDKVSTNKWKAIIDEASSLGCESLRFIGGEPTLHTDFLDLLRYAQGKFNRTEVYTNATTLTDAQIDAFRQNNVWVGFSFYSHHPEIHDRITGRKGSFDRTIVNIRKLVAAGISLRASVITTPVNGADEDLQATFNYLEELGIYNHSCDTTRGVGRGANINPSGGLDALCGACWSGKLVVTSTGDVYPCVFSRFEKVGDALAQPLVEILKNPRLRQFRGMVFARSKALPTCSLGPGSDNPDNCSPDYDHDL